MAVRTTLTSGQLSFILLTSSSVTLSKHLGHKVTVTGSPAQGQMDAMGTGVLGKGEPSGNVQCRGEIR
jgi:hypothetical protein